ncbi:MAG: hypothetical protein M1818_007804 [Claussenomyces sp. TS43310]|nr:MAG: hypothetical protein M1818_007804 [Claussenomyces sp. TS43310]
MSQSQQQTGQSRQPVSYPSPTSYPSPGLSNAQYSYPAPNQQVNEPYRASPTGSNGSLPLPSMRSLDPLQQQGHQQHLGSPLPPPVAQMGGPYYHSQQTLPHPSHQYPNVTSDPTGQNMRYALPVTDNRVMSGGRHKKCDEQHPACRNCQKSKRECLGYDPIFKQQPGPSPIQPAPSSAPSQAPVLATANPYGNQPILQGYGGVSSMNYDPALSAGVSSPGSSTPQFDYTSAIDPALEAVAPAGNANQFQQAPENSAYETPAKPIKIDDILPPPPATTSDISQKLQDSAVLDEVKLLYHSIYSPGLESFLESKWFPVKGVNRLLSDSRLLGDFAIMLEHFAKTSNASSEDMAYTTGIEGRVVWALASMVRGAGTENGVKRETAGAPASDDAVEAAGRMTVFENLLCRVVAENNPLTKPVAGSGDHHRLRELEFWWHLGQFVTLGDDTKALDEEMSALRALLDGRENRDVLYSICVVRGLGPRVAAYSEHERPLHLDEGDNRSKLAVATKFVKDEGMGSGTTNVIRRLCEMATRSWEPVPSRASSALQ